MGHRVSGDARLNDWWRRDRNWRSSKRRGAGDHLPPGERQCAPRDRTSGACWIAASRWSQRWRARLCCAPKKHSRIAASTPTCRRWHLPRRRRDLAKRNEPARRALGVGGSWRLGQTHAGTSAIWNFTSRRIAEPCSIRPCAFCSARPHLPKRAAFDAWLCAMARSRDIAPDALDAKHPCGSTGH